jgi:hypothetical protein
MLHCRILDLNTADQETLLKECRSLIFHNGLLLEELKRKSEENENLKQMLSDQAQKNIEIETLQRVVKELQTENKQLKEERALLLGRVDDLEERLAKVEARDEPITVREAMRVLERCICLQASGSTKKFKLNFFNFDKINKSQDHGVKTALANELAARGLTSDHCDMLGALKDEGDRATHDQRPVLTVQQLEKMLIEEGDDTETLEFNKLKLELLAALQHYCPPLPTGEIVIEDPMNKPKPKPTSTSGSGAAAAEAAAAPITVST